MAAGSTLPAQARLSVALGAATKRAFDFVVGGVLFLISVPLIVVLAIGVAISLRYWPFFVQQRPGRQGRTITIVKLRTLPSYTPRYMHKHVLGLANIELPWLCAKLRKSHLDELPQLASVVLGQMSLVGPRPALPNGVDAIEAGFDRVRRSVRPGCTGLWQLSVAAQDSLASAPRFDLFYVYYASLRLDIWIVLRTMGWVLGRAKPIELTDVPKWLLGPGLLSPTERRVTTLEYSDLAMAYEGVDAPPIYAGSHTAEATPARNDDDYDFGAVNGGVLEGAD